MEKEYKCEHCNHKWESSLDFIVCDNCMTYIHYDNKKLFIIAKHIAESDSIWEMYSYCYKFTQENFDNLLNSEPDMWEKSMYIENAKELYNKLFIFNK